MNLDRSAFDNLAAEIGREGTLQTFAVFFDDASSRLLRLRGLCCESESKAITAEAHGLKGSAANFGLRHVSELASKLEQDAQAIKPSDYEALLRNLETSYAAARESFAALTA
jgi:HPt (histidine-containing phosphotransfer) domain-containing protein